MKHENSMLKRVLISTILGMILGIFCIIGQAQRGPSNPLPNATIYLISAWYKTKRCAECGAHMERSGSGE